MKSVASLGQQQGRLVSLLNTCRNAQAFRATARRFARQQRTTGVTVRAMIPEWPDKDYVAKVTAEFPEKAVATVEEARVLYETGYTYLDVRPALELEEVGKVKNCVNIPYMNAAWKYNAEERKKVVVKSENPDFMKMVKKRFPKTDTKLIVACSDGRAYSMDALGELDEAGYTNIVGLRGGYYAWFRVFDNKLNRRRSGEYAEDYQAGGDSCGIHSSGAGFDKVDKIEAWVPRSF